MKSFVCLEGENLHTSPAERQTGAEKKGRATPVDGESNAILRTPNVAPLLRRANVCSKETSPF